MFLRVVFLALIEKSLYSQCAPPPLTLFFREGVGVEPPTKFSKRGGLTRPQLLEEVSWKRGDDFFQVGNFNFHMKK